MDYQTRIIVDASKANRDLEILEKNFGSNDKAVKKFKEELARLSDEKRKLIRNMKDLADANVKDAEAMKTRLKRYNDLLTAYRRISALSKNQIADEKHSIAMKKAHAKEVNTLTQAYTKYGIKLDATAVFMKRAAGNADLFRQKQKALNVEATKSNTKIKKMSDAAKLYEMRMRHATLATKGWNKAVLAFNKTASIASKSWRILVGAYLIQRAANLAIELERIAEGVDLLSKKLVHFSGNADALDIIKEKAAEIGASIYDMGRIITRFSITTKNAFSVEEMTKWTETLIKSARATGTTTQEMNNALIQLSQSFSAGRLQGDEYRSISENLPMLKQALEEVFRESEHAGVGLKELSSRGLITTEILIEAFDKLHETVKVIPGTIDTIDAAFQRFNTGWTAFVSAFGNTTFAKDSLNFLAAFFANLSKDEAVIRGMAKSFPELNKAAEQTAKVFRALSTALDPIIMIFKLLFENIEYVIGAMVLFGTAVAANTVYVFGWQNAIIAATASNAAFGASLTKTQKGLIALSVLMASYSLGTYLKEEYEEVEKAGVVLVAGFVYINEKIRYIFSLTGEHIKHTFNVALDFIQKRFQTEGKIISTLLKVAGQDEAASSIETLLGLKFKAISESDRHASAIANETAAHQANLLSMKDVLKEQYDYVDSYRDLNNEKDKSNKLDKKHQPLDVDKAKADLSKLKEEYDSVYAANKKHEIAMDRLYDSYQKTGMSMEEFTRLEKLINEERDNSIKKIDKQSKSTEKLLIRGKKALQAYNKELGLMNEYLTDSTVTLMPNFTREEDKFIKAKDKLIVALETGAISAEKYVEEFKKINETYEKVKEKKIEEHVRELVHEFDDVAKSTYEYNESLERLNLLYRNGLIDQETYTRNIYEMNKALLEVRAASEDAYAAMTLLADEFVEDFGKNINSYFKDALDGNEDAFDDFVDRIKDSFKQMLADMAYQALVQPIILNIQQSLVGSAASALGIGGAGSVASGGAGVLSIGSQFMQGQGLFGALGTGSIGGAITPTLNSALGGLGIGSFAAPVSTTGVLASGTGMATSAGTGFLGALGSALPYIGAGLGIASAFGLFDSDSDTTPDLNLSYVTGKDQIAGNPYFGYQTTANATDPSGLEIHSTGGNELYFTQGGRFATFGASTQHDAFGSPQDAENYAKQVAAQYASLEDLIFTALGEELSQVVSDSMDKFASGEIKVEEFGEDGANAIDNLFKSIFGDVFDTIGEVVSEDYKAIFKDILGTTDSVQVAVASFSALKGAIDAGSVRSVESLSNVIKEFVNSAGSEEEQMSELLAVSQILSFEELNEDLKELFGIMLDGVQSGTIEKTAQEILKLGTQLIAVNELLEDTGQATYEISIAGANAADELVKAAGGFEQFQTKSAFFYENFFSEEEKRHNLFIEGSEAILQFNDKFGEFGTISLNSTASLRDFANSLDLTTESGIEAYTAAMNLAPLFYESSNAMNELMVSFENAMETITKLTTDSIEKWTLDTLNAEEQYDYINEKINAKVDELQNTTDLEEIESLTADILNMGDSLWGLLDDDAKTAKLDEFIAGAEVLESIAEKQIELAKDNATSDEIIQQAMEDAKSASDNMIEASVAMNSAASRMLTAAKTEKVVTVEVEDNETGGFY